MQKRLLLQVVQTFISSGDRFFFSTLHASVNVWVEIVLSRLSPEQEGMTGLTLLKQTGNHWPENPPFAWNRLSPLGCLTNAVKVASAKIFFFSKALSPEKLINIRETDVILIKFLLKNMDTSRLNIPTKLNLATTGSLHPPPVWCLYGVISASVTCALIPPPPRALTHHWC